MSTVAPHISRSAIPVSPGSSARTPVYALVGNPNCGKSTLFNALTGLKQKVGNYPGVTVEKKIGETYSQHGKAIKIIDLPGAYSLAARSPDEAVTRDVLLGRRTDTAQPDRILCIVDATNLERNLYLVHQILDLGRPVILVLNMMDLALAGGLNVRVARLEHELGIPVIACEAVNGKGIIDLKLAMSRADLPLSRHAWDIPAPIAPAVAELQASLIANDGKAPLIARGGVVAADGSGFGARSGLDSAQPPHARNTSRLAAAMGRRGDRLGRCAGQFALRCHRKDRGGSGVAGRCDRALCFGSDRRDCDTP